ncbi:MAG: LacI family DNA-binding transcriptional regulator [Candidatus Humimicrobiaceae bacterium]
MKPTMKDVAKRAGVSMMTVSRVVNKNSSISEKIRKNVLNAIKELNYKPNKLARSLVTKKSEFITVVVPDISNPFFSEMVKGIEEIARTKGYNILLGGTDGRKEIENEYINSAVNRMSDGIILIAPRIEDKMIYELNDYLPLVVIDRPLDRSDVLQISIDDFKGAILAMEYLIDLNHKNIGFLSGTTDILAGLQREQGYINALEKQKKPIDFKLILNGDWSFKSGRNAFKNFYNNDPRPTAIFAANDLMAFGLIQGAKEMNVKIPEDLSVVGFDDIAMSALINPSLTTVKQPISEMGRKAVELLLNKLRKGPYINIHLECKLIIRESTRKI